jgi:enamine deaminase RidA (YjgF/YER057c/UK114 family)
MLASLAEPNISGYMQKMKTSFYSLSVVFIAAVALTLVSQYCFAAHHAGSNPEANLEKLGIALPTPSKSIANYVGARRIGNTIFLSGHLPLRKDKSVVIGKLGKDLTVEEGYQAARLSAIALLATLKAEVGDLSKVKGIAKVFGMVNATDNFADHSKVINGCSDLMVEVFGEKGRHARAASGFSSLPLGAAVEIEMIVEVEE